MSPRSTTATAASFLCLLLAAACGNVDDADNPDGAGGDDAPGGDAAPGVDADTRLPPSVVSITPADGAAGVAADATIVVVFSEPMDPASVEAAWTSTDLPAAAVAFAWNAAGDTLTVTPDAPLVIAEGVGTNPDVVAARAYAFSIAASAADAGGQALPAAVAASFTTVRRLAVELAPISALVRTMRSDGVIYGETATTLVAGDENGNRQEKLFAAFTLPDLPAGAALETATLTASQNSIYGAPYALGDLETKHVHTASPLVAGAFDATPLGVAADLATSATIGVKAVDVTARLADDLANRAARANRSQFRLEFPTATNANGATDEARFSRSSIGLDVTYLIP